MAAVMKFAATDSRVIPPENIRISDKTRMVRPEITVMELFFKNPPTRRRIVNTTMIRETKYKDPLNEKDSAVSRNLLATTRAMAILNSHLAIGIKLFIGSIMPDFNL